MSNFLNGKDTPQQDPISKEIPFDLSKLRYSIPDLVANFPEIAHVKSTQNFDYFLTNKNNLNVYGFADPDELIDKTVFDLEKHMIDKWPTNFASRVHSEDEKVIRTEKSILFQPECFLNNSGYVVFHSFMKIPLFEENKIKAILTLVFDSTKSEEILQLFRKYQEIYRKNIKLGNQKFLEYIGLEITNIPLTAREIECLIVLSKYKNVKNAARALQISPKTLETHLHMIKLKLSSQDLMSITKFFTSNAYRKF